MNEVISSLRALEKKLYAYHYATALIGIDEATAAPSDSGEGRGEAMELLSAAQFALMTGPELASLLAQAEALPPEALGRQAAAEVRELKRESEQNAKIPAKEYAADVRLFSDGRTAWLKAKTANDFSLFAPTLEKIVDARRRWAGYFDPDKSAHAVWLDHYQPGLTPEAADAFFAELRKTIVPLLTEIKTHGNAPRTDFLAQDWPLDRQKELSSYLMRTLHIPAEHCTLTETEHPFTEQLYEGDVRITTHYQPRDLVSNLYSVIHEGGHALYELNISPKLRFTVLQAGSCIGIHESQSRLFENYVGRSRGFLHFLWPELTRLFPEQLAGVTCEEFYRAVNRAEPSLIRTEADELTYPLHIMVRYELEKQLLDGSLSVAELPAAWNRLYKEYLGIDVPDDARGVLQDVHWSQGDLGYFPGYALGTAYAAQMVDVMKRAFDFNACCESGDLVPILAWQTEHLWKYGKELEPAALLEKSCEGAFDPHFFTSYLVEKYRDIYQL